MSSGAGKLFEKILTHLKNNEELYKAFDCLELNVWTLGSKWTVHKTGDSYANYPKSLWHLIDFKVLYGASLSLVFRTENNDHVFYSFPLIKDVSKLNLDKTDTHFIMKIDVVERFEIELYFRLDQMPDTLEVIRDHLPDVVFRNRG